MQLLEVSLVCLLVLLELSALSLLLLLLWWCSVGVMEVGNCRSQAIPLGPVLLLGSIVVF